MRAMTNWAAASKCVYVHFINVPLDFVISCKQGRSFVSVSLYLGGAVVHAEVFDVFRRVRTNCEKRPLASSCPYVRGGTTRLPLDRFFMKYDILEFF